MSTHNCFKSRKYLRLSSGLETYGALVISPRILSPGSFAISVTVSIPFSSVIPNLFSSSATLTSIRISAVTFLFTASLLISRASFTESTE